MADGVFKPVRFFYLLSSIIDPHSAPPGTFSFGVFVHAYRDTAGQRAGILCAGTGNGRRTGPVEAASRMGGCERDFKLLLAPDAGLPAALEGLQSRLIRIVEMTLRCGEILLIRLEPRRRNPRCRDSSGIC